MYPVFAGVGAGVDVAAALGVGVGVVAGAGVTEGVGFGPRNTSPGISFTPTDRMMEAFLLALTRKLYSPASATA